MYLRKMESYMITKRLYYMRRGKSGLLLYTVLHILCLPQKKIKHRSLIWSEGWAQLGTCSSRCLTSLSHPPREQWRRGTRETSKIHCDNTEDWLRPQLPLNHRHFTHSLKPEGDGAGGVGGVNEAGGSFNSVPSWRLQQLLQVICIL